MPAAVVADTRFRAIRTADDCEGQSAVDARDRIQLPAVREHVPEAFEAEVRERIDGRKIEPEPLVEIGQSARTC